MKAVIIKEYGDPEVLQLEDRPVPNHRPDEVLIRVKAAGVNRPDVIQRMGKYPAPPGAPSDIPGLEVAGIVEEVGDQISRWKPGDKICALVAGGGYAEYVSVSGEQCLPIPDTLNFTGAAGLPETVYTVWHNVFQRGQLQPGEKLLIHGGSSGIGITAIQLAKLNGAQVVVTVGTDEKGAACLQLGADAFINYKTQDFESMLSESGVDVILDMVGGDYFGKNINILNDDGRLVYINAMKGPRVDLNILQMMRKRLTITGSTLRNRETSFKAGLTREIEEKVWPHLIRGLFKPVIYKIFPLKDAADAHRLMESSKHIGKIILSV